MARFIVGMTFKLHGAVAVSAPEDATNEEILRLADEKSADVLDRLMPIAQAGSAESFPVRGSIRRERRKR